MTTTKPNYWRLLVLLSFFARLLFGATALGEILDVTIKGFDDGRKTSRQQDYKEAVLEIGRAHV